VILEYFLPDAFWSLTITKGGGFKSSK
jgi:hypothetical protein